MKKTLVTFFPFSAIDAGNKDFFDNIGIVFFTETLRLNLNNSGIGKNKTFDIPVPQRDKSGNFSFSILVESEKSQKKFDIIINESGLIKYWIFSRDITVGEWEPVETIGFMPMSEFDINFPKIMENLT